MGKNAFTPFFTGHTFACATPYFVKIMTELSQGGPRFGDNACTGEHLRVEMHHTQTFEVREEDLPELVEALALTKGRLPPGRLEED